MSKYDEYNYNIKIEENKKINNIKYINNDFIYKNPIDYDKIKDDFEIRNRQPEDYLVIDDQGRRKPLNRYFIDEKVPRDRRDALPLLACGHHVIWVPGYRISAYYKVDETTENILEVQVREEEKDE